MNNGVNAVLAGSGPSAAVRQRHAAQAALCGWRGWCGRVRGGGSAPHHAVRCVCIVGAVLPLAGSPSMRACTCSTCHWLLAAMSRIQVSDH